MTASRWPTSSPGRPGTAGWTSRRVRCPGRTSFPRCSPTLTPSRARARPSTCTSAAAPLAADPANGLADYTTSAINDAEHSDWSTYTNMTGFSDPAYDRLVEAGKATYDQAERTRHLPPGAAGARVPAAGHLPVERLGRHRCRPHRRHDCRRPARPDGAQLGLAAGATGGGGRRSVAEVGRGDVLPPGEEARHVAVAADGPRRDLLALVRPEDPGSVVLRCSSRAGR